MNETQAIIVMMCSLMSTLALWLIAFKVEAILDELRRNRQ